ncbi:MAG: Crp/Fnr family transcriptional regulator [Bacteroidota bacterium]|nr:Crp/Fnr family transcriptional regulator [Bacteroidota bacterium]
MITSKLKGILHNIIQFSEDEYEFIEPYFEKVVLKKNQILLEEGQLCNAVFFVESGVLRNYYDNNGLDVNLSFTFENQFTTIIEAYINREPSKISIQALEKSEVWTIRIRDISKEKGSFANLSTFIRRIAIRVLFATEEHHNMIMMNSPVDRYRYLLEKKPELIQRIPLTHLASYIGITRETLSRIRSNKY